MSKVIFGSGIIGLLAREILGNNWIIVPFSRSRFFSFSPALDDNYIVHDPKISDFMGYLNARPDYMYKVSYSVLGQLESYNQQICNAWLGKIFGSNAPPHASAYMKSRTGYFVYGIQVNKLYEALQNKYKVELEQNTKATVTKIGDHYYEMGDKRFDFEAAVSTIPINKLNELCGISIQLEAKQVWYYHIKTPDLDFEGANQVLDIEPNHVFYKVNNVAPRHYLFHCLQDIPIPGPYFMQFMPRFDIIDGTTIGEVIPVGPKPDTQYLKRLGVQCVGAHAEHDWCADIGSNIMTLLRLKSQPAQ